MVLYFMHAGSYNANTNCIMPESMNTIDLFNNAVGGHEIDNPDGTVFSENIIDVSERKKSEGGGRFGDINSVHAKF